jgi:oxygen-independent coproporphyrinogen-3 oxidase
MKIMCDFEIDIAAVEQKFDIDFKKYFEWGLNNMKEMEVDNLVSISDGKISVHDMGRLLIRNIAMNFDGYGERKEDKARYSRTV